MQVLLMTKTKLMKSYSELIKLPTFIERFRYLQLRGSIGFKTFDDVRWLNQTFYHSTEWRQFRSFIARRDGFCDLACSDRAIHDRIVIHHINPITIDDLETHNPIVLDPENVITTVDLTHKAIHYSDESILMLDPVIRKPFDTCPWRQ